MNLSFISILESVIVSSFMILLLSFVIKYNGNILYSNPKLVLFCALSIIVRSFLPYEFFFTITVKSSWLLPVFTNWIADKTFLTLSLYNWIIYIWIVVAIIKLFCLIIRQAEIEKSVQKFSKSIYTSLLPKIMSDLHIEGTVDLIEIPYLSTPVLIGYKKAKILIPKNLSSNDVYYILLHELQHYKQHDLYFITTLHILCIIYWWNPFFYLLKNITERFIEYRTDKRVTETFKLEEKLNYLECILNIAKLRSSQTLNNALELGLYEAHTDLSLRFNLVLSSIKKGGENIPKLFLVILLLSTFIIIEPYSIKAEYLKDTYSIPMNSYLLKRNGSFDLYINNEYYLTVDSIEGFEDLEIHY